MIQRGPWPRCVLLPGLLSLVLIYFLLHTEGLNALIPLTAIALWFAGVGKGVAKYYGSPVWPAIAGSFGGIMVTGWAVLCLGWLLSLLGVDTRGEMLLGLEGMTLAVASILGARRAAKETRSRSVTGTQ
jgi:hypothetical protein